MSAAEKIGFELVSKMELKLLSDNLQTRVSTDAKITNFLQCVTELVFNSLDSKATAVAVRINTLSFQLQVVDNGDGITRENMELIGHRYMTSKCSSLSDLSKRCKYYGYKGESLACVRELSRILSVTSRPAAGQGETFYKTFSGKENPVRVHKVKQRPSKGTTVNIEGFLFRHPVRQERINPDIELEEIKKFMRGVGIIHPEVSLSLRNELTGCVIFNHPKSKTVSNAIIKLCDDDLLVRLDPNCLHEIKVKKRNVSVSGLVYTKPYPNDKLQFIYINKRLTQLKSLSQLINHTIAAKLFKDVGGDGGQKLHPVYVLNVACPRFDFDCEQFKKWDVVLKCVEKLIGQASGGSPTRKSLSESHIKNCDDRSKHTSNKKVRSDSALEVRNAKSSKQKQKPKCIEENWSEEQSSESCASNFLYFRKNCNLVGGKPKKRVRQARFGANKASRKQQQSEIKEKGGERVKENVKIAIKSDVEVTKSNEPRSFQKRREYESEGVKWTPLGSIANVLRDQTQKSNSSQDVINAKKRLLSRLTDNQASEPGHFDDLNQGKEFIMDRFMKSLSNKSEYNILQDVSFVNEKGAKRLEKLNRAANLLITKRLGSFNHKGALSEPERRLVQSNSELIFPDDQKNPSGFVCKEDEPNSPLEESRGIPSETYKSHYNNVFLPYKLDGVGERSEDSPKLDDVRERFYQTIIETCRGAKLDDPSRFFAGAEDDYEKFKKDLDAYMLRGTPAGALFSNRTFSSTFVFRNGRKSSNKGDESFRLNINFTGVYQKENERVFEASKMSLFYTHSRRIRSDVASRADRTRNSKKSFGSSSGRNLSVDNKKNRAVVNQSRRKDEEEEDVFAQNLANAANSLNKAEQNEVLDLSRQENLFVDYSSVGVQNSAMSPRLTEKCIKQNHPDTLKGDEEVKGQHEDLILAPEENSEPDLRSQLVEEWIKQEDADTNTYFLNTRTGMSSSLNRPHRTPSKFTLKKRPQFIPKGLSPIVKHVEEVDASLPLSAKGRLQNAIIEVYDNDLEIIKKSNSDTRVEDLRDFLDQYYEENHRKFGGLALNAYNKYVWHAPYSFTRNLFNELQIIGQYDLKFIVSRCSSSGVIFLFDQHAVGERIQLEKLLKEYTTASSAKYKSTRCKEFTVEFPPEDVFVINNYRDMFERLGLSFQALEDRLRIKQVPLCFYNKSEKTVGNSDALSCLVQSLIQEELSLLRSTRGRFSKIPNCIRDVINSEACRGAVKFGDELSPSDCQEYIRELSKCQLPFHCAHGRPTIIPLVKLGDAKENLVRRLAAPNLKNLLVKK